MSLKTYGFVCTWVLVSMSFLIASFRYVKDFSDISKKWKNYVRIPGAIYVTGGSSYSVILNYPGDFTSSTTAVSKTFGFTFNSATKPDSITWEYSLTRDGLTEPLYTGRGSDENPAGGSNQYSCQLDFEDNGATGSVQYTF